MGLIKNEMNVVVAVKRLMNAALGEAETRPVKTFRVDAHASKNMQMMDALKLNSRRVAREDIMKSFPLL